MKHLFWRVFLVVFFCFQIASFYNQAFATEFATAVIRPSRTKVSTNPLPILITASITDNSTTEDQIQVVVGDGWSISPSVSNYTVTTGSLPAGVVAWPGIGTATAKSGQTITFPSGNLSSGVTYGFYITGGIRVNPSSAISATQQLWQLQTLASGSGQSQITVAVPVVSNDQIVVTGSVLPPSTDFSAVLTTSDVITDLAQNSQIEYTITYGSQYAFATPLTLVATWSEGTIFGSGSPSVELLEYVAGSATAGYGGTAPVIDLQNRTITWTINSFPGNTTNQTVSFVVETSSEYTGSLQVDATVTARISNPVSTVDSTSLVSYTYVPSATPVPTVTPTPQSGTGESNADPSDSTSMAAPTPTVSPIVEVLKFLRYRLLTVQDTTVELGVELNLPATLTVQVIDLETTGSNREQIILLPQFVNNHFITLDNLRPDTRYSVSITAENGSQQIISDQLQFLTAKKSDTINPIKLTVSADGAHVFSTTSVASTNLLVSEQDFIELLLELTSDDSIVSAVVYLEEINDEKAHTVLAASIYGTQLSRTQDHLWSGRLQSPASSGVYKIFVVIETVSGTKRTILLGNLVATQPIAVFDSKTKRPIERARLLLEKYNKETHLYELLKAPDYLLANPVLTDAHGEIVSIFPQDTYRVTVHSLGYKSVTLEFTTTRANQFPQFYLDREAFPFFNTIKYHFETLVLKFQRVQAIFYKEANSGASISVITLLTLLISTPLALLGFFARSHFSFRTFIHSLRHHKNFIVGKKNQYISGKVLSGVNNIPMSFAVVSVIDANNVTTSMMQTHKNGTFAIPMKAGSDAQLVILAPGFIPQTIVLSQDMLAENKLEVVLEKDEKVSTPLAAFSAIIKSFLSSALEFNLVLSFITAIIFTVVYRKEEALLFLIISLINLELYIVSQVSDYVHSLHFSQKE